MDRVLHFVETHFGWTFFGWTFFGWAGRRVRRWRPGLTVNTVGLIAVGFPAANSLSRIFVRIGYRLNGLPSTIPDSMPGSLDCKARGLQPPGHSVVTIYFRSE